MKQNIKVSGRVTIQVFDHHGNLKRRPPNFLQRLFRLPGRLMYQHHHNIITREGDALIADALLESPTKPKVKSATGYIQVGTGWTGNNPKANTRCNTPTGYPKEIDENYPVLKAAWGSPGDSTVIYQATFDPGYLDANNINEACLLNKSGSSANCLAYAQITPQVNVTSNDTLQVLWEITISGQ